MNASERSAFHFHADANPIGGQITQPVQQLLPPHGSASLAQAGGHASGRIGPHRIDGVLSFECAHSEVYGIKTAADGPWSTTVSSVIEGLNILDIVRADAIVAKIKVTHPHRGGPPAVSFGGTHFYNLTVEGRPIHPELNLDRFARLGAFARKPMGGLEKEKWNRLDAEAKARAEKAEEAELVESLRKEEVEKFDAAVEQAKRLAGAEGKLAWAKSRYEWIAALDKEKYRGHVLCSLVEKVDGAPQGTTFGHILHVPEVGNLFLGEISMNRGVFRVTMLRAEMGCQADGDVSAASGGAGSMMMMDSGGSGTQSGPF